MADRVLIPLTIPVKPIVRGYLEYNLGPKLIVRQNSLPGILLKAFLNRGKSDNNYESEVKLYDQKITVYIDTWDFDYYGYHLSKTEIRRFNTALTHQVYELLFSRLNALSKENLKKGFMKREIMDFMVEYNLIDYGLTYEACKKQYQRFRKDQQIRHKELQINLSI